MIWHDGVREREIVCVCMGVCIWAYGRMCMVRVACMNERET